VAGQWPLRSFLELGALPGAVPCARLHTRELIWGLKGLCDDVEILVSELVTNSVAASQSVARGLPVRLWLLCDKVRVLIVVWDGCPRAPVRIDVSGDEESGRGAAARGSHQRPVGVIPHAGDRRESGVGSDGGGVVTVTGEPVPGSGPVPGGRLGMRTFGRLVPGLGPLESAIMTAVWAARRPLTVCDARERLDYRASGGGEPAYTTVMTVMVILWRKGLLSRAKDLGDGHARAWWYEARVTREDHLAAVVRQTLACASDPTAVLYRAVSPARSTDRDRSTALANGSRMAGPTSG
jgi:predicted transcriptional regulator